MANVTVSCDTCGKILPVEDAFWDVGREQDFCRLHYLEIQISDLIDEKKHLKEWLNDTHHKKLRDLTSEIKKLKADLEEAIAALPELKTKEEN